MFIVLNTIKLCQYLISNPDTFQYDLGDQDSATFNYVDNVLTMTFRAKITYQRYLNIESYFK